MKPEELNSNQGGLSLSQQSLAADPSNLDKNKQLQNDAAAKLIRSQIDNLFESQKAEEIEQELNSQSIQLEIANPYQRTHAEHTNPQASEWKKYHTAWQNYYQKYYEGYYDHKNKTTKQHEGVLSKDDAVFDLRQEIIGKVQKSANKIKKSRHFIPIISGLVVILFFAFLQYNRFIFANINAYISPGSIDPQNIVIDPNANITVSPEPKLIIPKINVDVPVTYDIGNDYSSQMAAMTKGLAHFSIPGADSHPGQIGNTVLSGHSSNDLLEPGDYKFIFSQLDKLTIGDTIYANYESRRYTYTVTKKEIVKPSEVGKLVYETKKPIMTLITCTPLGTALNRLLITAEQISPDPSQSQPATIAEIKDTSSMPGNSPTFFERLFGNKN